MSKDYSNRIQFFAERIPALLGEALDQSDWKNVLDLGCGDGALLDALNKGGYFDGKTVYAIDLSQQRIDSASAIDESFVCSVADASDTRLEDGSLDFLITDQVIEHVPSDEDMVREIRRVMAPNGNVYIGTVFKKKYAWYFYRCNGKWTIDPTHVREYTQDAQLLDLLRKYGLQVIQSKKTMESRPLMDAILRRLGASRGVYRMRGLKTLRRLRLPIPGYFNWEVLCRKI